MANITATATNPPRMRSKLFSWALSGAATDVGVGVDVLGYSKLLLGIAFTSGGTTTVHWEGSHDNSSWFALTTPVVPTASVPNAAVIEAPPRYVRPRCIGSTALVVTATCLAR